MHDFTQSRAAVVACLLGLACTLPARAATDPVVAVESGKLGGVVDDGVASWKGIPYAAPPVGSLRWRPPQAPAGWSGVRAASRFGSDCMQLPFPGDSAPLSTTFSEDCLYLNVWKRADAPGKLPVIVWIHGGGFVNGGTSTALTSGAPLAKRDVMVVSFNYRLGRFGSFAHPALARNAADTGSSGNYGYLDQIAALKWVQRNISAFGGDPSNVTVVGESAGALSVNMLMTSPLAQGLFAKAAILSGGEGLIPDLPTTLAGAEQWSTEFGVKHGIAKDDPDALAKLRALTAEQVLDNFNLVSIFTPGSRVYAGPFVDNKVAYEPISAYAAGRFAKVPVMIGATDDDLGGRLGFMTSGARNIAGYLADKDVPVYEFRFSYVASAAPWPGGAKHATDVPYFFDTVATTYGDKASARDIAMGRTVSACLANFAKNGNPDGPQLPHWPRYRRTTDELMEFAASGQAVPQKDPLGPELDAMRSALSAK